MMTFEFSDKGRAEVVVCKNGLTYGVKCVGFPNVFAQFIFESDAKHFVNIFNGTVAPSIEHLAAKSGLDAQPVAFEFQHEDTGLIDFVDPQQVEWGFQKNNPRWQLIGPVFRHPAPVVVRQLVEALEGMLRGIFDGPDESDIAMIVSKAKEALAAAKEARL